MQINKAYKTELKPNNKQMTLLRQHAGTARYAYNWGLDRKEVVHRLNMLPVPTVKYPTAIGLWQVLGECKLPGYFSFLTHRRTYFHWTKINNKGRNSQVGKWCNGIIRSKDRIYPTNNRDWHTGRRWFY